MYDVYHRCKDLGAAINGTASYQYVTLNAPMDIYSTYMQVSALLLTRCWALGCGS